jgi:hypothetical protein
LRLFNTSSWEQVPDAGLVPAGAIGYFPSEDWKLGVAQMGTKEAVLWDSVRHRVIAPLKLAGQLSWAAFSPDGRVLVFGTKSEGGNPPQFARLDTETGRELTELWPPMWHWSMNAPVQWSGDGRFVVGAFRGEQNPQGGLAVWNSSTGRLLGMFKGCDGGTFAFKGDRLLGFCSVAPEAPEGTTEWSLDEVQRR